MYFKKKKSCNKLWFIKKCQNRTFDVNFRCQKSTKFFAKKKNNLRISIYLRDQFFSRVNFLTTFFFKLCPIFDELTFLVGFLFFMFSPLWLSWFLAKNIIFYLGPTIFKIPQPNWYYNKYSLFRHIGGSHGSILRH